MPNPTSRQSVAESSCRGRGLSVSRRSRAGRASQIGVNVRDVDTPPRSTTPAIAQPARPTHRSLRREAVPSPVSVGGCPHADHSGGEEARRSQEEPIATSGALTLLINCVMAWNTQRLQRAVERESQRTAPRYPIDALRTCPVTSTSAAPTDFRSSATLTVLSYQLLTTAVRIDFHDAGLICKVLAKFTLVACTISLYKNHL